MCRFVDNLKFSEKYYIYKTLFTFVLSGINFENVKKYWKYGLIILITLIYLVWLIIEGFPSWDRVFIIVNISFLIYIVITILESIILKRKIVNVELMAALILGILALQASWPIFMPRISFEDFSEGKGIIDGDKNEYQMIREATVRVKPPLFPLPFFMNRTYPVAENLKYIIDDDTSPNLRIINNNDGQNVRILLKRVTGWSFDEVAERVQYRSDKSFEIKINHYNNNNNILKLDKTHNFEPSSEFFPYDYRDSAIPIENYDIHKGKTNNFPVEIYNYPFSIYKDTEAWNSLKVWVNEGFCFVPYYSESMDYRSTEKSTMKIDGELGIISGEMFNSSKITIQVRYILLAPNERKTASIFFKKTTCNIDKTITQLSPYRIYGKVVDVSGNAKNFVILVKNLNSLKTGLIGGHFGDNYEYDLANLPNGYTSGDAIQVKLCKDSENCISSKNITVDIEKGFEEVNFKI